MGNISGDESNLFRTNLVRVGKGVIRFSNLVVFAVRAVNFKDDVKPTKTKSEQSCQATNIQRSNLNASSREMESI